MRYSKEERMKRFGPSSNAGIIQAAMDKDKKIKRQSEHEVIQGLEDEHEKDGGDGTAIRIPITDKKYFRWWREGQHT